MRRHQSSWRKTWLSTHLPYLFSMVLSKVRACLPFAIGTSAIVVFSLCWLLDNFVLAHCLALQCRGRDEMANNARTVAKPRWLVRLTAMDTGQLGDVVSLRVVIRCCPVLLQNLWRTAERSRVGFCHDFAAGSPNHMEVCVLLLARRR